MTKQDIFFKRFFDLFFSISGLIVATPLILLCWIVAALETKDNGFFLHERVGLNGKKFKTIKIRTMYKNDQLNTVTTKNDNRLTASGKFFRRLKLDEIPQLINICLGHMSFVGPRPDVRKYYDLTNEKDKIIYSIRPGLTGPASLKYKDEEEILSRVSEPIEYNDKIIWPDKVKLNLHYIKNYSLLKDFYYIFKTLI